MNSWPQTEFLARDGPLSPRRSPRDGLGPKSCPSVFLFPFPFPFHLHFSFPFLISHLSYVLCILTKRTAIQPHLKVLASSCLSLRSGIQKITSRKSIITLCKQSTMTVMMVQARGIGDDDGVKYTITKFSPKTLTDWTVATILLYQRCNCRRDSYHPSGHTHMHRPHRCLPDWCHREPQYLSAKPTQGPQVLHVMGHVRFLHVSCRHSRAEARVGNPPTECAPRHCSTDLH